MLGQVVGTNEGNSPEKPRTQNGRISVLKILSQGDSVFLGYLAAILIVLSPVLAYGQGDSEVQPEDEGDLESQVWICVLNLETSKSRRLFAVPDVALAGSPCVSPDETRIAFDASLPGMNSTSDAKLFLSSIDGSDVRSLGQAAMPSWSPDGDRLLISQYGESDHGVWNLKADCTDAVPVDETGWSGQWSPDGHTIVYLKGRDLMLYDVQKHSLRPLLGTQKDLFRRVYFNPAWSADSTRVYFKAQQHDGTFAICSRSVSDDSDVVIHIQRPTYANIGIAFDGSIIVPFRSKTFGTVQLHSFDGLKKVPSTDADAIHLQGQFTDRSSYGASMSPDRKRLYYVSVPASDEDLKAKAAILAPSGTTN
jgi:hypothetical protein